MHKERRLKAEATSGGQPVYVFDTTGEQTSRRAARAVFDAVKGKECCVDEDCSADAGALCGKHEEKAEERRRGERINI